MQNAFLPPELTDESNPQYHIRQGYSVPSEFYSLGAMPQIYSSPGYNTFNQYTVPMENLSIMLSDTLNNFATAETPEARSALARQAGEYYALLDAMGRQRGQAYYKALQPTDAYANAQETGDIFNADPEWRSRVLAPSGYMGSAFPYDELQGIGLADAVRNAIANRYGMNTYDFADILDASGAYPTSAVSNTPDALMNQYRAMMGR